MMHHILTHTKTTDPTGPWTCYHVVFLVSMRFVLNCSKDKPLSGHVTDWSEQHSLALTAVSHIQKSMQLSEGNDCFRLYWLKVNINACVMWLALIKSLLTKGPAFLEGLHTACCLMCQRLGIRSSYAAKSQLLLGFVSQTLEINLPRISLSIIRYSLLI